MRRADIVMALYLGIVVLYVCALLVLVIRRDRQGAEIFAVVFAGYVAASVVVACWLYRDLLERNNGDDSPLWLGGFLFVGGLTLTAYYVRHRNRLMPRPVHDVSIAFIVGRVIAILLLVITSAHLAYALTLALARLHVTHPYAVVALVDRWVTRVAILFSIVTIVRQPWRPARKTGWIVASILASALVIPVLYFARAPRAADVPADPGIGRA
jgi:hypothetical protein